MKKLLIFTVLTTLFLAMCTISVAKAQATSKSQWSVRTYVDEFEEPTNEKYMRNTTQGKFSNTATTNSCLRVVFLVDYELPAYISQGEKPVKIPKIRIMLYEYCRNHPVKNSYDGGTEYTVKVKSNKGDTRVFAKVMNFDDRLRFDSSDSYKLHKIFKSATTLKFFIYESDTPTTKYQFTVSAIGYSAAYKKLSK